jgi:hypothetical protein
MNSPVAHQGVTLLSMALLLLLMVVHGQLDPYADVAFFFSVRNPLRKGRDARKQC